MVVLPLVFLRKILLIHIFVLLLFFAHIYNVEGKSSNQTGKFIRHLPGQNAQILDLIFFNHQIIANLP